MKVCIEILIKEYTLLVCTKLPARAVLVDGVNMIIV